MRLLACLGAIALPLAAGCVGSTALTGAVKSRDLPRVKALVEGGADINQRDSLGMFSTPLGYAARNDAADVAAYLVSKGASHQKEIISYAAVMNRLEVVHAMLAAGTAPYFDSSVPPEKRAALIRERPATVARSQPHGNLDDAAYGHMRESADRPPEAKAQVSDIDTPKRSGAQRPHDFALVIGIEEYQSLPKADFGARDAKTVRRHLEALGFPPRNIISLEGSQATGNKLKSYLEEWLPLNVKPTSHLFVYYSGHGAPDPLTGEAYLVPWDGDATFLKSTAYPLRKLYADLGKIKAKSILVVLDACFSGAGGKSVLAPGARPLVAKVSLDAGAGEKITVLAAASGEEITGSLPDQGHGMFTYFLLKGLASGKTTARQLHDYLSPLVQDEARRQNRQQTPALIGRDAPF